MADNEEGEDITHVNEWDALKTAENEDGRGAISRANDWEVVSLTASTYAAAPGPRGYESIHEGSDSTYGGNDEAETSETLFMSGHFVFPPSQHENLPIVPEKLEISKGATDDDLVAESDTLKEGEHVEGLNVNESFPGTPLFEEKGHGPEFNESIALHEPNIDAKEQDLYGAAKPSSFHSATVIDGSTVHDRNFEASDDVINPSNLMTKAPKSVNEDEADDPELHCGAWWKRGVASLCAQAKEASAFWSIFVAAAVMGLVVLGQRWQQERWQLLHHSVSDEVLN
ncbi:hypothetical protein RND81_02G124300 [Saponaria officinalis]|uniref:ATG8-interacting protein 1 n=1 Tax=Saponaria officinalis TaxID=3572 RepID=A0AAW1ML52_SAPOF